MHDRHEEGSANDRPENWEGVVVNDDDKGFREPQQLGDPRPQEGADETQRGGNDQPAANTSREGFPDGATNGRDEDQQQQAWQ